MSVFDAIGNMIVQFFLPLFFTMIAIYVVWLRIDRVEDEIKKKIDEIKREIK